MAKRILIIDDAPSMRGLLAMALKNSGYEVIEASNGLEALERIKEGTYNLIISDLNMPEMDGLEFLRTIKSKNDYKTIPVVMLTTENEAIKKEEGKKAGAMAWIVKPFKVDSVQEVVKKIIG